MVAETSPNDDGPAVTDSEIVKEAIERWKACKDWQGDEDERSREDIKFANGDMRNGWQWPTKQFALRDGQDLPCLTINNTRVHNDMIINAMSKHGYGVKVRPAGGNASYKAAELMQTLIRRTQDVSRASAAYRKVAEQQVDGGIGYILIETAYVSERSFDQEIYLKASRDPTAVYLDPWIEEPDGLDANFGFIFDKKPKKEFNRKYPKYKNMVGTAPLDSAFAEWLTDKEVVLAKYYRKKESNDVLVSFKDEKGSEVEKLASEIKEESGKEIYDALMDQIKEGTLDGKHRKVVNNEVEWFLIAGDKIVERGNWAGKYIPIVRCVGRELVIDNTLDRKGHTRPLISAQHMLNYNASVAVQYAASSAKAQWLGSARAFEGQEQWKNLNTENYAALMYNDVDDEAPTELQKIDAPQRIMPPAASPAAQQGMQDAERQMMAISGQFEAQMGENDTQSAASGVAIGERKEQGDTATYHFVEHRADMLRAVGVQLLDLYPKIYDTQRTLMVIGDDGEKSWIKIDPNQTEAVMELQQIKDDEEAATLAFNPKLGQFECVSDPGPDKATQRQEAWDAGVMILQANKELAGVMGDLIFREGDFPTSNAMAERMMKEIKATKPYLFDEGADPKMLALQDAIKKATAVNAELMHKLAMKEIALKGKDERRDVEVFKAQTDRDKLTLDFLIKTVLSPKDKAMLEHELMAASHDASLDIVVRTNDAYLDSQNDAGDASSGAQ